MFELEDVKAHHTVDTGLQDAAYDAAQEAGADVAYDVVEGGAGGASGAAGAGGDAALTTVTLFPPVELSGDGFLASPDLCGQAVWSYQSEASHKLLWVGRDVPCAVGATYRAFVRFALAPIANASIIEAKLGISCAGKTDPTADVLLFEVADFGQLAASDWSAQERHSFGPVFAPSTPAGWVEVDVTAQVKAALSESLAAIAFKLQYSTESEDTHGNARYYSVHASEDGTSNAPRLVVVY